MAEDWAVSMSLPDDLEQLADLHRRGLLDDASFRAAKDRLLGAGPTESPIGSPDRVAPLPADDATPNAKDRFRQVWEDGKRPWMPVAMVIALIAVVWALALVMDNPPAEVAVDNSSEDEQTVAEFDPPERWERCVREVNEWVDYLDRNEHRADAAWHEMLRAWGTESPEYKIIQRAYPLFLKLAITKGAQQAAVETYEQVEQLCQQAYG